MNHNINVTNAPSPCDDAKLREIFARQGGRAALDRTASATSPESPLVAPGHIIPFNIDLTSWGLFLPVTSPKADSLAADQSPSDGGTP